MGKRSLHDLNHLVLAQEEMIEAYGRFVSDAKDPELRDCMRSIQENHFKNMMAISDRVMELGGNPKFDLGLHGIHEDMRHFDDQRSDDTSLSAARRALEAERKDLERILSFDLSDDDNRSHSLIEQAANSDKDNIRALEAYIERNEVQ